MAELENPPCNTEAHGELARILNGQQRVEDGRVPDSSLVRGKGGSEGRSERSLTDTRITRLTDSRLERSVRSMDTDTRKLLIRAQTEEKEQSQPQQPEDGKLRVLFGGDKDLIETLLSHNSYVRDGNVVRFDKTSPDDIRKLSRFASAQGVRPYDAVVFCTDVDAVEAFCKMGFDFVKRYEPPIVLVGPYASDTMGKKPNRWTVDTRGKEPQQLIGGLREAVINGKRFVQYVNSSMLLMMLKEPNDYDGKEKIHIVDPTRDGYEEAKKLLEVGRPPIGGVAIDGVDPWQLILLDKVDNESRYAGIPTAYVGMGLFPELGGYKCVTIPGNEVASMGIRRILEDFNPIRMEDIPEYVTVSEGHKKVTYNREGRPTRISTRFEFELPEELKRNPQADGRT